MRILSKTSVNLYKEYTSLKSRELEELLCFWVMIWQPSQLPWSASLCLFGKLLRYKGMKNIQTERIIPKIILVRILSIHPYAVLVGSN